MYVDLKIALADADSNEQWGKCAHLVALIAHCREWELEERARWDKKLAIYQTLEATN